MRFDSGQAGADQGGVDDASRRTALLAALIVEQFGPISGEESGVSQTVADFLAQSWMARLQEIGAHAAAPTSR